MLLAACSGAGGGGGIPATPAPTPTPTPAITSSTINAGGECIQIAQPGPPPPGLFPEIEFAVIAPPNGDPLNAYSTNTNVAIVQFSGTSGGIWGVGFGTAQVQIVDTKLNTVFSYYTISVQTKC